MEKITILHIETESKYCKVIKILLSDLVGENFMIEEATTINLAKDLIKEQTYDLVILDFNMVDSQKEKTFFYFKEEFNDTPIIILSSKKDEQIAYEMVRKGAQDFLFKENLDSDQLYRSIRYAIERKKAELKFFEDELTGLLRRGPFKKIVSNFIIDSKRRNEQLAILFLDLNKFKPINDRFGHIVGDSVLIKFGKLLKSTLRESDIVCRYGGDEFLVCIKNINGPDSVTTVVDKIHSELKKGITVDNINHEIGVSIGAAIYPTHAQEISELINLSDQAMYRAKNQGINQFSMFN